MTDAPTVRVPLGCVLALAALGPLSLDPYPLLVGTTIFTVSAGSTPVTAATIGAGAVVTVIIGFGSGPRGGRGAVAGG